MVAQILLGSAAFPLMCAALTFAQDHPSPQGSVRSIAHSGLGTCVDRLISNHFFVSGHPFEPDSPKSGDEGNKSVPEPGRITIR